ncbi:hypothetical protein [Bradyrhizobium liaoningense]|uniref:hypothetical protein n=1 Tax=Bradyrhizobium liaoningense TaxID=43992 RepID=UPI001BAC51B0|nr:hypothetical protein [Bradyrhizobium liaoningense]MBR0714067.1 hypothetical protein [Bradyrhizobium liaoningense]
MNTAVGQDMPMRIKFAIAFAAITFMSGMVIAETGKTLKPRPKDCSRQFLAAWDRFIQDSNAKPDDAPIPKQPCTMHGRTGDYVCDQEGCMKHKEGYKD